MESTSLKTIAAWCSGVINIDNADVCINNISIDSRETGSETLFFCIRGEKDDGHNYVEDVRKNGGYSIGEKKFCDITVSSTIQALADIAGNYIRVIEPAVIAVAGSSGKTTTTKIIEWILREDFNIKTTLRNFNNHIGLPVSVLNMDKTTEIGVLEMGANHSGEIEYLCNIAQPRIGVITNIGDAHIGYFGSHQAILDAKFEIAKSIPENGYLVYNYDQEEVRIRAVEFGDRLNLIGFGLNKGADVCGKILNQDSKSSIFEIEGFRFMLNIPGSFNVYNALSALAAAKIFNIDFEKIYPRLKEFEGALHRMGAITVNNIDILDDSYNANPSSVKSLFGELLKIYPQKDIIAVIGEMLELGNYAQELHQNTGEFISSQFNVKYLLAGGNYADHLIAGAKKGNIGSNNLYKFKDNNEAAQIIKDIADKDTLVVLKASRRQGLEEVIKYLEG